MTAAEGPTPQTDAAEARRSWTEILFTRKMLACIFLGFSSGMPLFVLVSLVPAWLRDNGVDLATIGLFALIGLPYTWKFLWSPIMDRFKLPFLGRRRGWALLTQVLLLISIGFLGHFDPGSSIGPPARCASSRGATRRPCASCARRSGPIRTDRRSSPRERLDTRSRLPSF